MRWFSLRRRPTLELELGSRYVAQQRQVLAGSDVVDAVRFLESETFLVELIESAERRSDRVIMQWFSWLIGFGVLLGFCAGLVVCALEH